MRKEFINKISIAILAFTIAVPFIVEAQTGNHFGEQKFLKYRIEYLDPQGVTIVDEEGITFKAWGCCEFREDIILPQRYFGDYPLYFAQDTLRFRVIIENDGPRTYKNLQIETFQEFLDIAGDVGEPMGNDNRNAWFIEKLGPGEEIILTGQFVIPSLGESGIDQTHLRVSHLDSQNGKRGEGIQFTNGQIILEDFQAGLWCPISVF